MHREGNWEKGGKQQDDIQGGLDYGASGSTADNLGGGEGGETYHGVEIGNSSPQETLADQRERKNSPQKDRQLN